VDEDLKLQVLVPPAFAGYSRLELTPLCFTLSQILADHRFIMNGRAGEMHLIMTNLAWRKLLPLLWPVIICTLIGESNDVITIANQQLSTHLFVSGTDRGLFVRTAAWFRNISEAIQDQSDHT